MVSGLMFKSLSCFELIFVIFFFGMWVSIYLAVVKELFPTMHSWRPCQASLMWPSALLHFWALSSIPLVHGLF
jgi:hypothetical protein